MTHGSKENYINVAVTKREVSFHRFDCWRGLPNNRLWDPAGIPDFHPRIYLNNNAGKLSRLTVANRRKATWFNMQKFVVNNYALGILVLKVTTTPQGFYFDRITESHRERPTT
jgi:hypothetical protein